MIIFRSFSFLICSLNAVNCPLNTALLHPTNSDNSEYFKNFSWDFLFGPYVTSGMLISRYGIFSCLSVTDLLRPGLRGGIVVVQLPSRGPALRSPVVAAHLAPLACTVPWSLRKFMSIESVLLSNHLLPPSRFAFGLPQHQGLFQWVSSSYQVAKVLELQL